jgi:hypothetical protein
MANSIAAETPIGNDGILWCEIVKDTVNATTGDIDQDQPVVGASDVWAFYSSTKELSSSVAIHADLTYNLTNISGTNRYYVYPSGDALRLRLLPTYKDQKVFVHFLKGTIGGSTTWHEVASTIITDERAAQ